MPDYTEEILEYELVSICYEFKYEVPEEPIVFACENSVADDEEPQEIEYDKDGIPMGVTIEEVKMRRQMIFQFYEKWKNEHPEKSVFNKNLNANILIRSESVVEAAEHASKRYKSTLAVMMLDELLENAVKVGEDVPKNNNKNQAKLVRMILMSFNHHDIGNIKLTVGVRRRSLDKIQYGITVLEPGRTISPVAKRISKKKASHNK